MACPRFAAARNLATPGMACRAILPDHLHTRRFPMPILSRTLPMSIATAVLLAASLASAPPGVPSYERFMSPASPQELVAARKVDRIAWVDYAEGKRNAYTAAPPQFAPVRLTNFLKDDGIMMSAIRISDDGSTVVFLRGEAPNRSGWSPNPSADPNGPEP